MGWFSTSAQARAMSLCWRNTLSDPIQVVTIDLKAIRFEVADLAEADTFGRFDRAVGHANVAGPPKKP